MEKTAIHDQGINYDCFSQLRNREVTQIGLVHLAMKVIIEAERDFFLGNEEESLSATLFFFGDEKESNYKLFCEILGRDANCYLPQGLLTFIETRKAPPPEYFDKLDKLYLSMTTK